MACDLASYLEPDRLTSKNLTSWLHYFYAEVPSDTMPSLAFNRCNTLTLRLAVAVCPLSAVTVTSRVSGEARGISTTAVTTAPLTKAVPTNTWGGDDDGDSGGNVETGTSYWTV